jgi:3-deoxy-D-manno-octulosonic-acid transferase
VDDPPQPTTFPGRLRERLFLLAYRLLWWLALPLAHVYLWQKGRREPLYRRHLGERWGLVRCSLQSPVWVHSASLGELRGAAPLIRALVAGGHPVFFTPLTPAGRAAAHRMFEIEIGAGRLQAAWAPLELMGAVRRLIRLTRPRCAIMTEIDTWPVLLATIRREAVPLAIANAQYPAGSLERDLRWGGFRAAVFRAYQLVLCKSATHAERFRRVGCPRIEIVGETRFDLPIPPHLIEAAADCVRRCGLTPVRRRVIAFASAVEGEDELFCDLMQRLREAPELDAEGPPLFVYVPRSPQRFEALAAFLGRSGLRLARRSTLYDPQCRPQLQEGETQRDELEGVDVLLGDSLGEMFFYLALAQAVVVGGSFVPLGAHNIIEPLALKKPVMVGPSIWGIEYPAVEAVAAGVLTVVQDAEQLQEALLSLLSSGASLEQAGERGRCFYEQHGGSTARHMAVLGPWIAGLPTPT